MFLILDRLISHDRVKFIVAIKQTFSVGFMNIFSSICHGLSKVLSLHSCLNCSGPIHINFHIAHPLTAAPVPRSIPTASSSHIPKHSTQRQLISHALPSRVEHFNPRFQRQDKMHNNFCLGPFFPWIPPHPDSHP